MKSAILLCFLLLINILTEAIPKKNSSIIKQVVQSGQWNDKRIWKDQSFPSAGDCIIIPINTTVVINNVVDLNNAPNASTVYLHGKLIFEDGGKLFLYNQSSINIEATGSIENQTAGEIFDRIRIGNSIYFTGNDEVLRGPYSIKKPASLTSFINLSVALEHKKVLVQWVTSKDLVVDYFELQRNIDKDNWTTVTTVKAEAPGRDLKLYKFLDNDPSAIIGNYRLKIVESKGAFAYSPIRSIRNIEPGPNVYIGACTAENIVLHFNQEISSTLIFKLESLTGDIVKYKKIKVPMGDVQIKLKDITPGNYMATVSGPSGFRYVQPVKL